MYNKFKEAKREAEWIIKITGLRTGDKVLDLCCGNGRHARVFAKHGLDTTGVDCCMHQVHLAKSLTKTTMGPVRYVCGDMRTYIGRPPYTVITCLGCSLGITDDKKEVVDLFKHVYSILSKGGYLIKDAGFKVEGKYGDLLGGKFCNEKTPLTLVLRK